MNMSLAHKVLSLIFNFLLSLSLLLQGVAAKSSNQPDLQAVDTFIQAQVKANRIPGLAGAIVQGDQVIFSKGYGEAAPGQPVTPQTQFYPGSVTRSFTALAALN